MRCRYPALWVCSGERRVYWTSYTDILSVGDKTVEQRKIYQPFPHDTTLKFSPVTRKSKVTATASFTVNALLLYVVYWITILFGRT